MFAMAGCGEAVGAGTTVPSSTAIVLRGAEPTDPASLTRVGIQDVSATRQDQFVSVDDVSEARLMTLIQTSSENTRRRINRSDVYVCVAPGADLYCGSATFDTSTNRLSCNTGWVTGDYCV